jgi:hypothetical protein
VDIKRSLDFFKEYKWSSFRDYFGSQNSEFSKIINKDLFYEFFDTDTDAYYKEFCGFLEGDGYGALKEVVEMETNLSTWQVDK